MKTNSCLLKTNGSKTASENEKCDVKTYFLSYKIRTTEHGYFFSKIQKKNSKESLLKQNKRSNI